MTRAELMALIHEQQPGFVLNKFAVVGIRGYYMDTMGTVHENDRGIYDDAIFILTDSQLFPFNANTDPSKYSPGIAKLRPGVWSVYKFDKHKGKYLALCQRAGNVTVDRDGKGSETGMFGINIHKGGFLTTSSLGCQTIYPDQWDDFIAKCQKFAKSSFGDKYTSLVYTYVLLTK